MQCSCSGTTDATCCSVPTPAEILVGLGAIANDAILVAILWHVILALFIFAAALGSRPSRRTIAVLIALLPASVAAIAFIYGNPFNGVVLTATACALVVLGISEPMGPAASRWWQWSGAAILAYGWVYPHFVVEPPLVYLVAAPVGLVPCPSLAVAIGLALLSGAGNRAWRWTLGAVAAAFALFGALRLGVILDLGLLAAALVLAASTLQRASSPSRITAFSS
jgi:hypothetical protein